MSETLIHIGKMVKKQRTKLNLTLKDLSEKSGLNINYISSLESGSANITINKLEAVCQALGVAIVEVFPIAQSADLNSWINKINTLSEREKVLTLRILELCLSLNMERDYKLVIGLLESMTQN